MEFVDAGLYSRSDVVSSLRNISLESYNVCSGYIPYVDVISCLLSGAVDRRGPVGGQVSGEDGNHPGLPVRILARSVDVRVAQRRVEDSVLDGVKVQVALC